MALAEMLRVQLIAHAGAKMPILSSLQEAGLVHLEEARCDGFPLNSSFLKTSHLEHLLHRLKHGLDFLSRWEQKGAVRRLFTEKPQVSLQKTEEALSFDYTSVLDMIEEHQARHNDLASEIKFLDREVQLLFPLQSLSLPLQSLSPTTTTEIILGSIPVSQLDALESGFRDEAAWFSVFNRERRNAYLLIFMHRDRAVKSRIDSLLREAGFVPIAFSEHILKRATTEDRVADVIEKIRGERDTRKAEYESLEEKGRELARFREKLLPVHDILLNEKKKLTSASLLGETDRVFYLEGWVCASDVDKLKSKLEPYADASQLYFRSPLAEEDPPVVLTNPKQARPFEVITKLYGLPSRGSFDPTLPLAPFFFIFVGLTVSEAGYGFLVSLLSLLFLKFGKPKGSARQFTRLLFLLGVANIIIGTLVGGWFGFPIRKLMVLDPLQDPLSFLILSLILGFVQVWFGTLLNLIGGIKNKQYLQSICVQGGWLLLLPSLVLYLMTKKSPWGILSLIGAAGIVFFASPKKNPITRIFGGLYSLYDISRYLGDVLSYSRLLALGLATGVIAMVVNTLCQTALGIPWIGWLFAGLIFVGGHVFNLGISFLGGFVHSMRLQFVEFFTKFFKSGGKPFKPLELESRFCEFVE